MKNKPRYFIILRYTAAIISLAIVAALVSCSEKTREYSDFRDPVYERVLESGIIRASYTSYAPYCVRDANTGEFSGVLVEILQEAARRLDLKIEWTEEIGWGSIFEGLNSDRYDIFAAGAWRNASRGKRGIFTDPLFFNVIKLYGRPNEKRFSEKLEAINSPDVKISTLDGAIDDLIARIDYPKAERVSVPEVAPWTDVLMNIITKKADVTFAEPGAVNPFLEKNPGTLVELAPDKPIRVFPVCFPLRMGAHNFKSMMDSAINEIHTDGTIEKILSKYEKNPGEIYRVALPYRSRWVK